MWRTVRLFSNWSSRNRNCGACALLAAMLICAMIAAGCGSRLDYSARGGEVFLPPTERGEGGHEMEKEMARSAHWPTETAPAASPGSAPVAALVLKDVTLEDGLRAIRKSVGSGPPLVALPSAVKAAGGKKVSCEFKEKMTLEEALAKFLALFDALLTFAFEDEAYVVMPGNPSERMVTMTYPIERLLAEKPDFKPPKLDVDQSDLFKNDSKSSTAPPPPPQGGAEGGGDFKSADELVEFIKNAVAPGTWSEGEAAEEGKGTISVTKGILTVKHTMEVQRQVAELLARLGG